MALNCAIFITKVITMKFNEGDFLFASQLNKIINKQTPAYRLISKLESGDQDCCVIVNSDSTGITGDYDGAAFYNKWPYKIAKMLAERYPKHTTLYYDVAPAFYNAPTTLNQGTNGKTLHFYNAAIAGTQPTYLMGNRFNAVFNPRKADLIIYNHGHNTDGNASQYVQQGMNLAAIYSILKLHPSAGVLVVSQNPLKDSDSGLNRSVGSANAAMIAGFGLVDVYSEFMRNGKPDSWYRTIPASGLLDPIHPSKIGDDVIFNLASDFFDWPTNPKPHIQGLTIQRSLIDNGDFKNWTGEAPDGWVAKNVTLAKESTSGMFESGDFSMKITTNSNLGGVVEYQIPASVARQLSGSVVTISARVYVPASNTLSNAARFKFAEIDNTSPYGIPTGGRDGWIWKSVVAVIPPATTTLTLQILADAAGNAAGSVCYFDRIVVSSGGIPQDAL
jgi:hypothetical protein